MYKQIDLNDALELGIAEGHIVKVVRQDENFELGDLVGDKTTLLLMVDSSDIVVDYQIL